jgi:hypothetical protein
MYHPPWLGGWAGFKRSVGWVSKSRVEDAAKARLSADIVGYSLGASSADILAEGKGAPAAVFARQVAMYLCYTGFELSLARVAVAFERDRSTGVACTPSYRGSPRRACLRSMD